MQKSIVALAIYVFIKENIIAKEVLMLKDHPNAALAVIKKRDSALQLGIPVGYETLFASYNYDENADQEGLKEELLFACPANNRREADTEYYLKYNKKDLSEDSTLFFTREYWNDGKIYCHNEVKPSVNKSEKVDNIGRIKYCGEHKAEIYNVGYPVIDSDEKGLKIQFMSIYKICHSTDKDKGTLYTIHRIKSPSLMMQQAWEFYTFNPLTESFESSLDKSIKKNKALFKRRFAYQFVGFDDMPTRPWALATLFYFNYVPIPKNEDLLTGMIAADNYIRLFSKNNNKRLTLYSGSHQATKKIPIPCLPHIECGSMSKMINLFWRIIIDDESNDAVIMITQYTLIDCDQELICNKNQAMVQKYAKGGCTYTCQVTPEVIDLLGLPPLKIKELLTLKFTRKIPSDTAAPDEQIDSPTNSPEDFTIYDIKEREKFKEVLKEDNAEFRSTETGNREFTPYQHFKNNCGGSGGMSCFGGGGGGGDGGGGGATSWLTLGMIGGGGGGYVGGGYDGGGGDGGGGGGGE